MYFLRYLVTLILMSFVLFQQVYAESLDKIAAVVNENVITNQEVKAQLALVKKQIQQKQISDVEAQKLRQQVLQHMIDVELQLQMARSRNIEVTSEQVSEGIRNIARQNKISLAQMKKSILSEGLSWQKYRENIKREMLISKLQQESIGDIQVTDSQVEDYLKGNKAKNLKYHVKDILLSLEEAPSPEVLAKANAKAQQLLAELKKGADFSKAAIELSSSAVALKGGDLGFRSLASLPKMFADKVVMMKVGQVAGPIRAANGLHIIKLVAIKGEQAHKLVTLTHAQHILLKVEPGMSSEQVKHKLQTLALQIKRGRKFEEIAKKFSDDVSNAAKGGDLGWVHKGETVPEFEKAYEKLALGQVSQPVKTAFGWHLIKVLARKDIDDSKAFEKQQVKQALYQRKFQEGVANWMQQLRANSYIKINKDS